MTTRTSQFLKEPVPPTGTKEWRDWQARCRELGHESVPVFLDALENGDEPEQYAALLSLRLFGWEAFGEGYGSELRYRVTEPGGSNAKVIRPRITPEPYTDR